MITAEFAARATAILLGAGLLISGIEWWALLGRKLAYPRDSQPISVLSQRLWLIRVTITAQIIAAVILIVIPSYPVLRWAALALVVTIVVLIVLTFYGVEAADYVNLAIIACLGIYYCQLGSTWTYVTLYGIALVATLSYLIGGFSKLISPYWGNGQALLRILDSATYGSTRLYRYFSMRIHLLKFLERVIIAGELAFPIIFLLPFPLLVGAICIGIAFHLAIAGVMGLNLFTFSYLATYPSIIILARVVTKGA